MCYSLIICNSAKQARNQVDFYSLISKKTSLAKLNFEYFCKKMPRSGKMDNCDRLGEGMMPTGDAEFKRVDKRYMKILFVRILLVYLILMGCAPLLLLLETGIALPFHMSTLARQGHGYHRQAEPARTHYNNRAL